MTKLTEMNLKKSVLILAFPVVARMSLQSLVGLVDTAMVGRIGPAAIAAVGISNQIVFFLIGIITAFSIGTTTLVAQYIGAERKRKAQEIAMQSLLITVFLSLIIGFLGFIFSREIIGFLIGRMDEADPEILNFGSTYLRIISLSTPFFFSLVLFNGIFQGAGDMKTPLFLMACTNIYNAVMDYFLIFGIGFFPELGVTGAAIATGSSRIIAAVAAFFLLLRGNSYFKIRLSRASFRLQLPLIRDVLRIGIPAAMEHLIRSSGQTLLTILVAGLGTIPLAAHQVAMRGLSLAFMPAFGFGLAATTLVGQNLGAGFLDRARESGYTASRIAMMGMAVLGIALFALAPQFTRLFIKDELVIAQAAEALRVIALTMPFLGSTITLSGALRGAGDTRWVLYITALGVWGGRIGLSYILAFTFNLGLIGAWLGLSIDFLVRFILTTIRFGSDYWQKRIVKVRTREKTAG